METRNRKTQGNFKRSAKQYSNFDLLRENNQTTYDYIDKKKIFYSQQIENYFFENNKSYEEPDDIESKLLENE
jgi:hypothetical protein